MRLSKSFAAAALLFIYSGAVNAQLLPFTPSGYSIPALSSTTTSAATTMPAGTQSVLVQNVGADGIYCQPGPTATSTSLFISQGGGSFIFSMAGYTQISCIDQNTTSTVNFIPGSGYAVVASGGGGGGSGSSSVTQGTSPWVVSGSVTANAGTNLNTSALATSANQTTGNTSLGTIATNTGASVPAGTNAIGSVAPIGTATLATGHVSCPITTETSIISARTGAAGTGRASVTITNMTGTQVVDIGNTGVTTGTGIELPAVLGATITLQTTAAIHCIATTGAQAMTFVETY